MGGDLPKQYLSIAGKTVLEHSILALLASKRIEKVVVAVSVEDQHWRTLPISQHPQVDTCAGGEERQDSVLAALRHLSLSDGEIDEQTWVLVHDAVRPCVQTDSVDLLIDTVLEDCIGGLLAVPARDTLKQAVAQTTATETCYRASKTLDRSTVWQAQTPQMFRLSVLQKALEHAITHDMVVTDEASAIEAQGGQPQLVMGRHDNIKITWPEDLAIAEALLAQRYEQRIDTNTTA